MKSRHARARRGRACPAAGREADGVSAAAPAQLVLGCIDSYDSEKWRIFQIFRDLYTIFTFSHRSECKISTKFVDFFAKNI